MQRALGASEPPGLPMIKPQSKDVHAAMLKRETHSKEEIHKPVQPQKPLDVAATAKVTESPVLTAETKKVATTDVSLPDKTTTSEETAKRQAGAPQQQPGPTSAKSASSTEQELGRPAPHISPKAGTSPAKPTTRPAQPTTQESGGFFGFGGSKPQPTSAKPAESVTGKMFGFGSSLLSSASTLITSAVQDEPKTTPPTPRKLSTTGHISPKATPPASPKPAKDTKSPPAQKAEDKTPEKPQREKTPSALAAKVEKADTSICPLCKVKLNMGSNQPPDYNTCTECKTTVCNLCGFDPMPNVTEVNHCYDNLNIYFNQLSLLKSLNHFKDFCKIVALMTIYTFDFVFVCLGEGMAVSELPDAEST